jgi:hypothetical protein
MPADRGAARVRIVIELERDREPIEGEVTAPPAQATHFRGWLSLTALIEAARLTAPPGQSSGTFPDAGRSGLADDTTGDQIE